LIGVGGALCGSVIGGFVSIRSVRDQIREERFAEVRSRRADAYPRLLDAATRMARTQLIVFRRGSRCRPNPCLSEVRRLEPSSESYARAANEVFVYGSDEAFNAERRIAQQLWPAADVSTQGLDQAAFDRAYVAFQRVMCRELSADPRPGCADAP
jgi:hypothetical protein